MRKLQKRKLTMKNSHSKILKRGDGSSVKINVWVGNFLGYNELEYRFNVTKRGKRKRLWNDLYDCNDYDYRSMSLEERRKYEYKEILKVVTEEEIHQAKIELWESLKPSL